MKGTILNFKAKNCRVFRLNSSLSVVDIFDFSYFKSKSNNNFKGTSYYINLSWIYLDVHTSLNYFLVSSIFSNTFSSFFKILIWSFFTNYFFFTSSSSCFFTSSSLFFFNITCFYYNSSFFFLKYSYTPFLYYYLSFFFFYISYFRLFYSYFFFYYNLSLAILYS